MSPSPVAREHGRGDTVKIARREVLSMQGARSEMRQEAKRCLTIATGIAALALLSGAWAVPQGNGDRPAAEAREELERLIAKSVPVRDITAKVLSFEQGRPARIPTFRYFWSGELGWSRLEIVGPLGHTLVFFVDEHHGRVRALVGKDLVALDEEGARTSYP